MKNKSKLLFSYIAVFFISFISCEKDFYEDIDLQKEKIKEIEIKAITYEDFSRKMQALKTKPAVKMIMNKANSSLTNHNARTGVDSDIEIYTDIIKEITSGTYKSYTMYIKTPDSLDNKIYNLTLEEKEGETAAFITKYSPTENWINNKEQPFEGGITTYRVEPGPGGSIKFTDINDGETTNESGGSTSFPIDCNGVVISTTVVTETLCGCGHSWQQFLTGVCGGSTCGAPTYPSLSSTTVYECITFNNPGSGTTGSTGPSGTSGSTGNNNNSGPSSGLSNSDGSITIPVILPTIYDECLELKKLQDEDKQNINPILNELKDIVSSPVDYENGYQFKKDANGQQTNTQIPPNVNSGNSITFTTGGDNIGAIHTHTFKLYPIFSFADLWALFNFYMKAPASYKTEVTLMVVSKECATCTQIHIYALKVNDYRKFGAKLNWFKDIPQNAGLSEKDKHDNANARYNKMLQQHILTDIQNLERVFLEFIEGNGVSLYKANDDLSNWSKLELSNNPISPINQFPCD